MKNIAKILTIVILVLAFHATATAQTTATANGNATVVVLTPIAISETTVLNFGTIIPDNGTVVIAPDGTRTPTGVTVVGAGHTAGSFSVTGDAGLTFDLDISAAAINIGNGTDVLVVDSFVGNPADGTTNISLAGGPVTINVGATLHVVTGITPGTYDTATSTEHFTVTVNYN